MTEYAPSHELYSTARAKASDWVESLTGKAEATRAFREACARVDELRAEQSAATDALRPLCRTYGRDNAIILREAFGIPVRRPGADLAAFDAAVEAEQAAKRRAEAASNALRGDDKPWHTWRPDDASVKAVEEALADRIDELGPTLTATIELLAKIEAASEFLGIQDRGLAHNGGMSSLSILLGELDPEALKYKIDRGRRRRAALDAEIERAKQRRITTA